MSNGDLLQLQHISALVDLSVGLIDLDLQLHTLAVDLLHEVLLGVASGGEKIEQLLSTQGVVRDQGLVNAFDRAQFGERFLRGRCRARGVLLVVLVEDEGMPEEVADGKSNGGDGDVRLPDHGDANVSSDDRRLKIVQKERLTGDVRRGEQPLTVDVFAVRPEIQTQRG